MSQKSILLIHAHPYPRRSRINRALRASAEGISGVSILDLYETFPDFHIPPKPEQTRLEAADVLVLQHPFYWYSCPALLKEWIDVVFEKGFAYGERGTKLFGKHWWQVISSGGPDRAYQRLGYNHFSVSELLRPFEQTAYLCGMIPLKPYLIQDTAHVSEASLANHAREYRRLLEGLTRGENPPLHSTLEETELR